LADRNRASAGELIITRSNDRRLRTSASDWVKNGDRWIVLPAVASAVDLARAVESDRGHRIVRVHS
jgi:hypothetical protein